MDYLQQRFRALYIPECNVSLDEGLVPFKGRLSMKVYNPKKPPKYGVKLYILCEAQTGYALDFITYAGIGSTLQLSTLSSIV